MEPEELGHGGPFNRSGAIRRARGGRSSIADMQGVREGVFRLQCPQGIRGMMFIARGRV